MVKSNQIKEEKGILSKTQMNYSLEEFLKTEPITTKYFQFPIHYKKVEDNYIIYRGKNWQQHRSFKTLIFMPATAYLFFNRVYVDCTLPGLLNYLPSDYQIILAIFPNAPENKFPTPILHLQKTISLLLQQHNKYLVDPLNVILSGYSCGGTMTIPLGLYFASQSYYFKSLLCFSPLFDYSGTLQKDNDLSEKWGAFQKQDFAYYAPPFIDFVNRHFSRSKEDLTHPWYSPYFTPAQDLKKLRNFCFIYGQKDFGRRTIEAFKHKLTESNIASQSIILNGEGHNLLYMAKVGGGSCEPYADQLIPSMKTQVLKQVTNYLKKILV